MANDKNLKTKVCILGGGPAGYCAAIRCAQLGIDVVLIEKNELGGTCLNSGCIPTKALLKTAELVDAIDHSDLFGISASYTAFDIIRINARKDEALRSIRTRLERLLGSYKKITIVRGEGIITSPHTVKVASINQNLFINCDKLIITSGSKPLVPKIPGIDLPGVITSDDALKLREIPANIIILGAGPIGLEFATLLNTMGTKVTIVELNDKILPQEDLELTTELLNIMQKQGIDFKLRTEVKAIKKNSNNLTAIITTEGQDIEISAEKILIAIGRSLNVTPDMAAIGLKMNGKALAVNEYLETNIPGVYAAGDVKGGKLMAHLAFAEGKVAAENANGAKRTINYSALPGCVYTHPELASMGMNQEQAVKANIDVKIGRYDFNNNAKNIYQRHTDGFIKVVIDEKSDVILGAQILGLNASEMISELTLAVTLKAKASDIANMIHPHPTLSEAIMEACSNAQSIEHKGSENKPTKIPPENYLFTADGYWLYIQKNIAKIGITDFMQHKYPDITSCSLAQVGTEIKRSNIFGSIESRKTVIDLISPVSGKIIAINDAVIKSPELLNNDPYAEGWMLEVELTDGTNDTKSLLNANEYITTLKTKDGNAN